MWLWKWLSIRRSGRQLRHSGGRPASTICVRKGLWSTHLRHSSHRVGLHATTAAQGPSYLYLRKCYFIESLLIDFATAVESRSRCSSSCQFPAPGSSGVMRYASCISSLGKPIEAVQCSKLLGNHSQLLRGREGPSDMSSRQNLAGNQRGHKLLLNTSGGDSP